MNRLASQSSPYLQQHADNPVEWHPWDAEALALAERENKPILLSIGYASNHRCRVMARESFENQKVAQFMNKHFVNIKVDREERPDLDRIYQTAQQLLNRQPGGWPLTMFLDPKDRLPIYGGTYFPPQQTRTQPSFREVLAGISTTYNTPNDKMAEFKEKLNEAFAPPPPNFTEGDLDDTLIDRACGQIDSSFDAEFGGFTEEPKLPHAPGLDMMCYALPCVDAPEKHERLAYMIDFTLTAMACGGIYDHLAGGFFSVSVDTKWTIPHFEKMLFENGMLLSLYAQRARATKSDWLIDVCKRTADFVVRDMQLDNGGLISSLDADSDDIEGGYYLWTNDEVYRTLKGDDNTFSESFGLNGKANFGASWHLRLAPPDPKQALLESNPVAGVQDDIATLLQARRERPAPTPDDKVNAAWTSLAIVGLLEAATTLEDEAYANAATKAIDYLKATHWQDGKLHVTSRAGEPTAAAYLDDYAYLLNALLAHLGKNWRKQDLEFATALADKMIDSFEDREHGGFFFTAHDHESLIQRQKPFADDPLSSGNGAAIVALLELGNLLDEARYRDVAERALRAGMDDVEHWPSAHAGTVKAYIDFTRPPLRVVLRAKDTSAATPFVAAIDDSRARAYLVPVDEGDIGGRAAGDSDVTAFVYRGTERLGSASDLDAFKALLAS